MKQRLCHRGKHGGGFGHGNEAECLFREIPPHGRGGGRGGARGGRGGARRGGRGGGRGGMGPGGPPGPFGFDFVSMDEAADSTSHNSSTIEKDDEAALRVYYDVAGYSPEDIDVRVQEGGEIHVTGSRVNRVGMKFQLEEIRYVDLATYAIDQISSEMTDGVLEIVVPKTKISSRRSVPININTNTNAKNSM